ncbi:MAG: hypothetical protein H6Q59_3358 [Firmicutes bacterium]|nr:hypothetical protein [Bacillota bacterium]
MNLDDYREAMKEIPVDTTELEAKLYERIKTRDKINNKNKVKRTVPALAMAFVLLISFFIWNSNLFVIPDITMKVYAAEQEIVSLSKEFVTINSLAQPFYGGYTVDPDGSFSDANITYNIHLLCEGEGIDTITYSCSEEKITRNNRSGAKAYYVENVTLPVEEYNNSAKDRGDDFICGFYGEGEATATIIRMIGSSYTVAYNNQENINYGLVVAATVEKEREFHCEDLLLTAKINMTDGSVITKKLLVAFGEDAFHEVQIKIIK